MRDEVLDRLAAADLVRREGDTYRTTRRWQAAMARAAVLLYEQGADSDDLRLPIALALVDIYGSDTPDDTLAAWVEAMLPIEKAEVMPQMRRVPRLTNYASLFR